MTQKEIGQAFDKIVAWRDTEMRNGAIVVICLQCAMILAGSACSKPAARLVTAKPVPVVDLTGTWSVSAEEGQDRILQLVQKGTTLTGTVQDGPVAGEVTGNHVKVWLLNNPAMLGIATVDGNTINGTYPCSRENRPANWSATRMSAQATSTPDTTQGK